MHALTNATVAAYHRKEFGQLTDRYPDLKHNMESISSNVLAGALDQVFCSGPEKGPRARVVFYLIRYCDANRALHPERLMLPMTRKDIADYLGLTIETVSRAFSKLSDEGVLEIDHIYECHILDLAALQEMASSD